MKYFQLFLTLVIVLILTSTVYAACSDVNIIFDPATPINGPLTVKVQSQTGYSWVHLILEKDDQLVPFTKETVCKYPTECSPTKKPFWWSWDYDINSDGGYEVIFYRNCASCPKYPCDSQEMCDQCCEFCAAKTFGVNAQKPPTVTTQPLNAPDFESLDPMSVKGINYFPGEHTWERMWENWDQDAIRADLDVAKSLGVNVIRVPIDFNTFGADSPSSEMLGKLSDLLGIADSKGMKVMPVLLDGTDYPCGSILDIHIRHVVGVIGHFKDDPRIFAWDLKNEPGLSCSMGDADIQNIKRTVKEIRKKDTTHRLTVGLLQKNAGKASQLSEFTDIIQVHVYDIPNPGSILDQAISGANGKPVIIGEFGCMSTPDCTSNPSQRCCNDEEGQKSHLETYLNSAKNKNIAGTFPWILEEFATKDGSEQNTPTEEDKYFGMVKLDGTLKPAANALQSFYSGGGVAPTVTSKKTQFSVGENLEFYWLGCDKIISIMKNYKDKPLEVPSVKVSENYVIEGPKTNEKGMVKVLSICLGPEVDVERFVTRVG
jgi:hypothetical protein